MLFHRRGLLWLGSAVRYSSKKAGITARLMAGAYVLQSVRAKFNQYSVDPTCLLCGENPEDHEHFLLRCRSLTGSRD